MRVLILEKIDVKVWFLHQRAGSKAKHQWWC